MVIHWHKLLYSLGLILVLGFGASLLAQTIEVYAPQEVEQGRPFTVVYQLKNYKGDLSPIDPKHEGLDLLYGPALSKQSSVSIYNGQVQSSSDISFTYTFLAAETGKYTISGFRLQKEDGSSLSARSTSITTLASRAGGANMSRTSRGYFYRTVVSRTSVYEQEALPVSYRVYASSRFGIVSAKAPIYDGFISQSINDGGMVQLMREDYQGATYQTADISREILFPQRSGVLQIPEAEVVLQIPIEVDDDPFLGQMIERKLKTSPQTITVKPLPEQGRPTDFSGAVGQFKVSADLSTKSIRTNEALTLTYRIRGIGNLKIAKLPTLSFARELEVYDPKDETEQEPSGNSVQAQRTIEYSIIPRHTGTYQLPALNFSFFNPTTQSYQSVQTEPITIKVEQGRNISQTASVVQTSNIAPDKPFGILPSSGATSLVGISLVTSWLYPLIYLGLICLFLGAIVWLRHYKATRADVLGYSASKAKAFADKRLRQAKKYDDGGQTDAFYDELLRALWGYMSDKLRLPTSELSRSNVREHLETHRVDASLIDAWIETIETVEFARFAPASIGNNPGELYDRARDIIMRVEASPALKRSRI